VYNVASMEKVDILLPPTFKKAGITKTLKEAWQNGDWIGTFNLWVLKDNPEASLVYQIRSPQSSWAPNKLDVTAGGHYSAGEEFLDGLREAKEELGRSFDPKMCVYMGRKIHVGVDVNNNKRHNLVDIYFTIDNFPLNDYVLEKNEVYAICECPIEELIKVHTIIGHTFQTIIHTNMGERAEYIVNKESFPYNWDDYHLKIALLAKRFLAKESNLIY